MKDTFKAAIGKILKEPNEGSLLGRKVKVSISYPDTELLDGVVVRDDGNSGLRLMIIRVETGAYVLSNECYSLYLIPAHRT